MNGRDRFQELDVLRGFAAVAVMLSHYLLNFPVYHGADVGVGAPPFDDIEGMRAMAGVVAVALFFIISGYVIVMSVERSASLGHFLYHRFARLFPVFWVAVLTTSAVGILLPLPGVEYTARQVALNLTMMPTSFGVEPVDDVYWSLLYELRFYILLALIMALGGLSRLKLICWGWLAVMVMYGGLRLGGVDLRDELIVLNTPFASFFIAGMALYRLRENGQDRGWWALLVLSFAVNFLCFRPWFALATLPFLPLFVLAIRGHLAVIVCRPLLFLGTISYSLYLFHMMIGYSVIFYLMQAGAGFVVSVAIAMVSMTALSALMTFTVERPAQRWLRRVYRDRQAKMTAPVAGAA